MNTLRIFLFLSIFSISLCIYAQDNSSQRSFVVENKIGAEINIPLDSTGTHSLTPSIRTVFGDSRKKDNIASYNGSEVELCYTYSPWSFMSFSADMEVDFTRGGETIFSAYVSANPHYKYKRLTVYGELKLSSNRRLAYHDHLATPHLNYMAGIGIDAIKNVMNISAQCRFPHDLKTNDFDKIKAKLKLKLILSSRINLSLSHEVVQNYEHTERTNINNFTFSYSL